MRSIFFRSCFIITLLFSSCAVWPYPKIEVENAWVREAKISAISAGDLNQSCVCDIQTGKLTTYAYMKIKNSGGSDDRLTKVESDVVTRIEMRRSGLIDDLTSLEPVDGIDLPAGGEIAFAPGEYALLLMGIQQDLKPGDKVSLALIFEKSGRVETAFEIREQ